MERAMGWRARSTISLPPARVSESSLIHNLFNKHGNDNRRNLTSEGPSCDDRLEKGAGAGLYDSPWFLRRLSLRASNRNTGVVQGDSRNITQSNDLILR